MGQGTTNTGQQQSTPSVPAWLRPMLRGEESQYQSAMGNLPSLSALYGQIPLQGTAPFSGQQNQLISQISGLSGQPNAAEQAAQNEYTQFMAPGGGESQASQAEMNLLNTQEDPMLMSQASMMGQGNSGAALQSLAQANQSALLPILQRGTQNQLGAAGAMQDLGAQEYNQQTQDLQNALQAAGMPQQLAQQQSNNLFNQLQQQVQYAQGVQQGPFGMLGQMIGGGSGTSVTVPPKG